MNTNTNIKNVLSVIETINNNFYKIFKDIDDKNSEDPYDYYLGEHCASYSKILCNIFKENATKYCSSTHVITKIGSWFYDVAGILIEKEEIEQYHSIDNKDEEEYYLDTIFNNHDDLEQYLEENLTEIGINKLNELTNNKILTKNYSINK